MVSCVGFTLTVFGLLIWSVHHSNNTGGPYFARDYQPDALLANSLPWAVIYGATSVLGNVGVVTLSQADWCRFAKNGNRIPMIAQIVACPLMIYAACMWNFHPPFFSPFLGGGICCFWVELGKLVYWCWCWWWNLDALGIVVTSAASQTLGSALWQPYLLLRAIQKYQYVLLDKAQEAGDIPLYPSGERIADTFSPPVTTPHALELQCKSHHIFHGFFTMMMMSAS